MATNGKIWLVVSPTVGLPVFFAAAAVTALAIHLALLSNGRLTAWWSEFPIAKPAAVQQATPAPAPAAAPVAK
jgi:light-harvesting protein B-800-850 alpha chain